jgi:tetratricopeptide (TPR) repeat protein
MWLPPSGGGPASVGRPTPAVHFRLKPEATWNPAATWKPEATGQSTRTPSAVRVSHGSIRLPTSVEGPANPNPPFDLFTVGRFNYPYPIRDAVTGEREPVTWRTLQLENEYLRLVVLPDLGGHIYSCLDKRTGREMFYANTAIKKALIGYRGAWAAFGVEFNFPVSHNWMSMSPIDFATVQGADGSGSIWVGNTDRVYGSRWRVELTLRPGRSVLEQKVELYNASDVRHRYYWWSNAAVQAWDDSRLVYPTETMATHGFTSIEPWPVDRQGKDISVIRNQTDGPVSLFTFGTREGFVGVYHPRTSSGTVHVANPAELPVHKVWSWGNDRDAISWRTALSDDDSAYVELQAGLFRNQETYAFLDPQESVQFTEFWLPVRDLGGITRATADAVLHMDRPTPTQVRVALDVTRDLPGARITTGPAGTSSQTVADLSPRDTYRLVRDNVSAAPWSIEVTDAAGNVVLRHTEHAFDRTPASQAALGPQAARHPSRTTPASASGVVQDGGNDELEGRRLVAMSAYREALRRHPRDFLLLKSAGRLAVALRWPESMVTRSLAESNEKSAESDGAIDVSAGEMAIEWLRTAHALNTTDADVQYYLGVALAAAGRWPEAQPYLESAQRFRATRVAATLQLALRLEPEAALRRIQAAAGEAGRASALGRLEVSLLRRLGRRSEALERARTWARVDPADSVLRYEVTLLGEPDPDLWPHLGADVSRVLDLADYYFASSDYGEALRVLERDYPVVEPPMREPGAVLPRESPLVAYYRGFARMHLRQPFLQDHGAARALSTQYVFPSRASSYAVLAQALRSDPDDDVARFLLGSLYLAGGLVAEAVEAWQRVRRARPAIPTVHRNLGLALLHGAGDLREARAVLEEGTAADPDNVDVYLNLDGVLSAVDALPRERVDALRRHPGLRQGSGQPAGTAEHLPSSMVFKLAIALAESGRADEAERLFHGRFFLREEGGTNVRAVYAQVRLTSARVAAAAGACQAARGILDSLPSERQDLDFTRGGLADALQPPPMARQIAAVDWTCGRQAAARARWERLERPLTTGGSPLAVAVADEARRRLGRPRTAGGRRRLEEALESVTRSLESGTSSSPGSAAYIRSLLLDALGRGADARRSRTQVFIHPDRNLSHAFARATAVSGAGEARQ